LDIGQDLGAEGLASILVVILVLLYKQSLDSIFLNQNIDTRLGDSHYNSLDHSVFFTLMFEI